MRSFGATAESSPRGTSPRASTASTTAASAACVKHFPGHGDTSADTHLGAATVEASLDELSRARAGAVRSGDRRRCRCGPHRAHRRRRARRRSRRRSARRWTDHLRDELGFDGVIITDALDMERGRSGRGVDGVADAAVDALAAGADFLCLGSNFDAERDRRRRRSRSPRRSATAGSIGLRWSRSAARIAKLRRRRRGRCRARRSIGTAAAEVAPPGDHRRRHHPGRAVRRRRVPARAEHGRASTSPGASPDHLGEARLADADDRPAVGRSTSTASTAARADRGRRARRRRARMAARRDRARSSTRPHRGGRARLAEPRSPGRRRRTSSPTAQPLASTLCRRRTSYEREGLSRWPTSASAA